MWTTPSFKGTKNIIKLAQRCLDVGSLYPMMAQHPGIIGDRSQIRNDRIVIASDYSENYQCGMLTYPSVTGLTLSQQWVNVWCFTGTSCTCDMRDVL